MNKFEVNFHDGGTMKMKGFKMTFDNGYTISVQFGSGTYSDGGKTTAEVGAWDSNGEWVRLEPNDDVRAYCSPEDVLEAMNFISKL